MLSRLVYVRAMCVCVSQYLVRSSLALCSAQKQCSRAGNSGFGHRVGAVDSRLARRSRFRSVGVDVRLLREFLASRENLPSLGSSVVTRDQAGYRSLALKQHKVGALLFQRTHPAGRTALHVLLRALPPACSSDLLLLLLSALLLLHLRNPVWELRHYHHRHP